MERQTTFILVVFICSAAVMAVGEMIEQCQVPDHWGNLEARMTEQVGLDLQGDLLEKEIANGIMGWQK